ncbi:hypothetical protein [Thermococcus sp.]
MLSPVHKILPAGLKTFAEPLELNMIITFENYRMKISGVTPFLACNNCVSFPLRNLVKLDDQTFWKRNQVRLGICRLSGIILKINRENFKGGWAQTYCPKMHVVVGVES